MENKMTITRNIPYLINVVPLYEEILYRKRVWTYGTLIHETNYPFLVTYNAESFDRTNT